jgi:hypothetical protein
MAVLRKSIDYNTCYARDNIASAGCSIIAVLFYLFILIVLKKTSVIDWICWLGSWLIPIMLVFVIYCSFMEAHAWRKRNQRFRREAVAMETAVVSRDEGHYEDDGYTAAYSIYSLTLQMTSEQAAVCPGETEIVANVSMRIFKWYEDRTTAKIYYYPFDPLAFLLQEEL